MRSRGIVLMRDCSGKIEYGQMAHVIEGLAEVQAKFKSNSAHSFIHPSFPAGLCHESNDPTFLTP